jgi:hypothetical protein
VTLQAGFLEWMEGLKKDAATNGEYTDEAQTQIVGRPSTFNRSSWFQNSSQFARFECLLLFPINSFSPKLFRRIFSPQFQLEFKTNHLMFTVTFSFMSTVIGSFVMFFFFRSRSC